MHDAMPMQHSVDLTIIVNSYIMYYTSGCVMQMRKARDFQRLAERENEGQGGGAPPYRGPDGSGQWVSMGELGDNDLDSVLGSLGGGDQLTDNRTVQDWKCIRYKSIALDSSTQINLLHQVLAT